ncbi:MAG: hypothetical protein AAF417_16035 [Pseudomonadota bacterium]
MATIKFDGVKAPKHLVSAFNFIKGAKAQGRIDEHRLAAVLGVVRETGFVDLSDPRFRYLSPQEIQAATPKWDYGSWIDALNNCDLRFDELRLNGSSGEIRFEQMSWPSGGLEATEELVRIFDGRILSSDAE